MEDIRRGFEPRRPTRAEPGKEDPEGAYEREPADEARSEPEPEPSGEQAEDVGTRPQGGHNTPVNPDDLPGEWPDRETQGPEDR